MFSASFADECRPIRSNEELLAFWRSPIVWYNQAQPLIERCPPRQLENDFLNIRQQKSHPTQDEASRPKVLVCHDLAGNYRGDRWVERLTLVDFYLLILVCCSFINGSSKWDDYRFYHWAGIDYFCYFSHSYITIPPLPWINAAHRNGVPILGTFIVESSHLLEEVLESKSQMLRIVECLVKVTQCCCFDGWLLNIECAVDRTKIPLLRQFVRRLTERIHEELPDGKVFWYDSVVLSGRLLWQNELNEQNIDFFDVSDGILLNYNWTSTHLTRTARILNDNPILMAKVFVGIDVFGRGQVAKFHSRETLSKIKQFNFSVGIFAPAWTFERILDIGLNPFEMHHNHSDTINRHFMQRNHLFWTLLWNHFYSSGPKALPFSTSFCLGSGRLKFRDGILTQNMPWFNIAEQEYQPSVPSVYEYHFDDAYRGGCCLQFHGNVNKLRLFVSDFRCDDDLVIAYAFKRSSSQIRIKIILKIVHDDSVSHLIVHCGNNSGASSAVGEKHILPLNYTALDRVMVGLSERKERILHSHRPINDWHSRYYYLKFDRNVQASRVIDVGVSIVKDGGWTDGDYLKLGAFHMHAGIPNDGRIAISNDSRITSHDFFQSFGN